MPLATYKDLCIDAVDPALLGAFWARVLGLDLELLDDGDARLVGPSPQHTVWINRVPEAKSVKHRVHLDVRAASPDDVVAAGARVVDAESFRWVVMTDPEGGELCVFPVREGTSPGLMGLVVDTGPDHRALTDWWAEVLGGRPDEADGFSYVELDDGPVADISFVPVPEVKTVKNRVHPDVWADDIDALVARGARILRAPDTDPAGEVRWHVLADPEGNEFCAFARP